MDLGFSGVIEKFEEYWGRQITRGLLMLIGLGVAAVCLGAIWEWIISPLLVFFRTPVWRQTIGSLLWAALTIGVGLSFGFWLVATFLQWRRASRIRTLLSRSKKLVGDAKSLSKEADERVAFLEKALLEATEILEETIDLERRMEGIVELAMASLRERLGNDPSLGLDRRAEISEQLKRFEEFKRETGSES